MDDTRDIALEARASASSAHKRLDKINGQIERGAKATEELRENTTAGFAKLAEDFANANIEQLVQLSATNVAVAKIGQNVKDALKVAAVIVSVTMAVIAGVSVYMITHLHLHPVSPPSQATTRITPRVTPK